MRKSSSNYSNPAFQNAPNSPPPFPSQYEASYGDFAQTLSPQQYGPDISRSYAEYNTSNTRSSTSPTPPTSGTFPPNNGPSSPPLPKSPPHSGRASRFKSDFGHLGDVVRKRGSQNSVAGLGIHAEEDYGTTKSNAGSAEGLRRYPEDGDIGATSYTGGGGMNDIPDNVPLNPQMQGTPKGGYGRIPSHGNSPYLGVAGGGGGGYSPNPSGSVRRQNARYDWIAITVIILAVYSTIASLAFIILATLKPRYKIGIGGGTLSPQTASLLSAFFAKTIELSFVTVFVAFLGQVLSRRAFLAESRGFNLAELNMRVWIMQPGSLFTNFHSVRFAGLTFLGALSLTAAFMALLYTTASDTLVSPKLQWSGLEKREMKGLVLAQFADVPYLSANCRSVIPADEDGPDNNSLIPLSQTTCFNIKSAGQGYNDLQSFLNTWNLTANQATTEVDSRAVASTVLNTTSYSGYWMQVTGQDGLNNVTLAMPHSGLVWAAKNVSTNNILQPENSGIGQYDVTASIPNPAINVMCKALTEDQLTWFMGQYNPSNHKRNGTADPELLEIFNFHPNATITNQEIIAQNLTKFEAPRFLLPIGQKYPLPFNTEIWSNQAWSYFDPNIYFVAATNNSAYTMCSIRAFLTVDCSTQFQAMLPTGLATVDCKKNNRLAYKLASNFIDRPEDVFFNRTNSPSLNYKSMAFSIGSALALNTGQSNGNASVSRILSQLALDKTEGEGSRLNPKRPSLAEALAVLFGNTLVQSSKDTAFTTFYDYNNTFPPNVLETFNVEIASMIFSSGASKGWQPIFYIVLVSVFLANVFCLVYFLFTKGFVTDWTETENLFTLSLNSPAPNSKERVREITKAMQREGQPDPRSLKSPWMVKEDNGKLIIADLEDDVELERR